jgi:hypothetical protein
MFYHLPAKAGLTGDRAEFFTEYKQRFLDENKGSDCGDTLSDQTYKEDTLAARMNTEKILSCLQKYAVSLNQQRPDWYVFCSFSCNNNAGPIANRQNVLAIITTYPMQTK